MTEKFGKIFNLLMENPSWLLKFNLVFSLNVDWFQPYSHTQSSVGVIYLTILNLPRHLRNNRRYTLLVGVIPGPNEPKRDINSFLYPMVRELVSLWHGEHFRVHSFSEPHSQGSTYLCSM